MVREMTYYDKAMSNIKVARIILDNTDNDQGQLGIAGFHLQQAMEFVLKYLLDRSGIKYPKTHDLNRLIRMGCEANVDLYLPKYLEDHAEILTEWERDSHNAAEDSIEHCEVERTLQEVDDYLVRVAIAL